MKINYLLVLVFITVIIYAGVDFQTGIVGSNSTDRWWDASATNVTPDASNGQV